jgi:acyl phosphate:glycerol-3-phosphate acyltransferase
MSFEYLLTLLSNNYTVVALVVFAYLTGSLPTSYIFGRIFEKIDLREFGSGNVGATNALRVLGWKIGLATLLIDMCKGFVVVIIAQKFFPGNNIIALIVGLAAILGHVFTIFLNFKGGKGVATSAGVFAALIPVGFLIALAVFVAITALSRYVSLGSIFAAVVLTGRQILLTILSGGKDSEILVIVIPISLFIIVKHLPNIKRLINGTENKIRFSRKQ